MASVIVVGLGYLGTTCVYSAIGFGCFWGVTGAVTVGATAVGGYLAQTKDLNVPSGTNFVNCVFAGALGSIFGGVIGTVAGSIDGVLFPIRVVLLGTYYGTKLTYTACTVLVSLALLPARALVFCVTYSATATLVGGKYIVNMVSKNGEEQKIELDPQQWEKSFDFQTREALLCGEKTEIQTYVPVSTKHLAPKEVYDTYINSKEECNSWLMKSDDDYFYIIQPEKKVPVFLEATDVWDKDSKCHYCDSYFGYVYTTRHHCRKCGHSVCQDHSTKEGFAVNRDKYERLCDNCCDTLIQEEENNLAELRKLLNLDNIEENKIAETSQLIENNENENEILNDDKEE